MVGQLVIEIGGDTRRLTFGQNAWYLFCKLHKIPISDVGIFFADSLNNPEAWRDMVYCSLKAAALADGKPIDFNQYTVGEWIDALSDEAANEILTAFMDSRANDAVKKKEAVNQ